MVSLHFRALVNFGGGDLLLSAADFFLTPRVEDGYLSRELVCFGEGGGEDGRLEIFFWLL